MGRMQNDDAAHRSRIRYIIIISRSWGKDSLSMGRVRQAIVIDRRSYLAVNQYSGVMVPFLDTTSGMAIAILMTRIQAPKVCGRC